MNLALVIASLGCGGAERVMSILANHWARHGETVTLVTIDGDAGDFYSLDAQVRRVALNVLHDSKNIAEAVRLNALRLRKLRRVIAGIRPDAVISFMDSTNVLTLLATRGLAVPVVVAEHTDPRRQSSGREWDALRRWMYPRADAVILLSEALRGWAGGWIAPQRLHVIPNPVVTANVPAGMDTPFALPPRFVVGVGRLSPEKGFDLLLEAFARAAPVAWSLVILGEGPERAALEKQVRQLGLYGRVSLPGATRAVEAVLRRAALFVLSSHHEGFPMALVEAMNAGLSVVSFDCPVGPADIITHGVDGVLVPEGDVAALAAQMERLIHDAPERARLGESARASIQRYSVEYVADQWAWLLGELTGNVPGARAVKAGERAYGGGDTSP
jgi:glycosyltransferase involved in cell wall biosynthesis